MSTVKNKNKHDKQIKDEKWLEDKDQEMWYVYIQFKLSHMDIFPAIHLTYAHRLSMSFKLISRICNA